MAQQGCAGPMRFQWTLLLALLLTTAGCLDSDGDDDDGTGTGTGTGTSTDGPGPGNGGNGTDEPMVERGTGTTGVTAGVPGGGSVGTGGEGGMFSVPDGATALLAEIRWDDPVQDVDLALSSPSQEGTSPRNYDHTTSGGSPGAPDTPHQLMVPNPEEGEWHLTAFGNGASANMAYEWAVTVFFDDIPEGYTAFE